MRYAVIDIGSNSVRLLLWADGSSVRKQVYTVRLGEGLAQTSVLSKAAMLRTLDAIGVCVSEANLFGANQLFAFATAAVRSARNGSDFVNTVCQKYGIHIDVLSGEQEAETGLVGALEGRDGGIVDVGGASSEVIIGRGGKVEYSVSANIGAVRVKDVCGEDFECADKYIADKMTVYGEIPNSPITVIGGTATSLAALEYEIEPYDPERVNGSILTVESIENWAKKLYSMPQAERVRLKGMERGRADILGGGALILCRILQKIGAEQVTVSESDNTEGYLMCKLREMNK